MSIPLSLIIKKSNAKDKQTNNEIYLYICIYIYINIYISIKINKIELQNSVARFVFFLCRITDIKIAWTNL